MKRQTMDDLHGATAVCRIVVTMDRGGNCKVEGSITDKEFADLMLDTAKTCVANYHDRARLIAGKPLFVPAYDTALVGTDAEKKLLKSRGQLADAM